MSYSETKQQPLKAIIIGSGIAGLAAAIRLAVQHIEVVVYEKNGTYGGKLGLLELNGYRFDTGPSLFVQPENIEELFVLAGENMSDYFEYTPVDIACKYFYEDGIVINAYTDKIRFADELAEKLHEDANHVLDYLKQSEDLYNNVGAIFLNNSLHKTSSLLNSPIAKALRTTERKHLFGTMHAVHAKTFKHQHTVQLFDRYATYNGSSPYKAPGMLSMIPHLEYNHSVFYPKGGMISITNALYALAVKKGVQFHFNAPAQRIINNEKHITGVVVNNENIAADIVISNADIYNTYRYLLKNDAGAVKVLKQERSSSAFVFYWAINKTFPELQLHNIFFSKDYKAEFEHLFTHKKIYNDPTVYVNITGKCEPGMQAPPGKENWFVMVNASANAGQDWLSYKHQYRAAIISKLNRVLQTDIEPLIEAEQILDPVMIEANTASYMGSLYGTSSNSRMAAFLRHPNFSKKLKGLYFTGGSVHPGGGIPLCLKSAKITCDIIAEDFKTNGGKR